MDQDFSDLQRLLRLKRHEAPPPEYFEDFLFDFHRRQREEMLKRPVWRIALDRLEGALPSFSLPRYAYASGCAAALATAVMVSGNVLSQKPPTAQAERAPRVAQAAKPAMRFDFNNSRPSFPLTDLNFDQPTTRQTQAVSYTRESHPRYVLDAQPVSYEQPSSF